MNIQNINFQFIFMSVYKATPLEIYIIVMMHFRIPLV